MWKMMILSWKVNSAHCDQAVVSGKLHMDGVKTGWFGDALCELPWREEASWDLL